MCDDEKRKPNSVVYFLGMLLVVGGVLLSTSVRVKKDDTSPKEVEQNPQRAKDTFYYNGDNIKEYKGESIFYVDMERQLTEKQGKE